MADRGTMIGRAAVVTAALALGVAAPAAAQEADRWTAWLGCWEPVAERLGPAPMEDATRLCIERADAGVRVIARAPGETPVERSMIADGERREAAEGGCTGWESATWSAYGQRLYVHTELECAGFPRVVSGIMAMMPGGEWLDVRSVTPGPEGAVRVVRYRAVDEPPADRALAVETARAAAARSLTPQEVAEAAWRVDPVVVEALLLERGDGFELDAETLADLAETGVPDRIVDVMVALSFPDRFAIDRDAGMVAVAPDEPSTAERRPIRSYDPYYVGYRYRYDPFFYSPYSWRNNGYYDPYGRWGGPPIIIVRNDDDGSGQENRGRRVKGQGYQGLGDRTVGTAQPANRGSTMRAGSASSGASRATSGSSGSSSTGRKAKPRGSGGK